MADRTVATALAEEIGFVNQILVLYSAPLLGKSGIDGNLAPVPPIDIEAEISAITEDLRREVNSVAVDVHVRSVSNHTLRVLLSRRPGPTILHFVGHGSISDGIGSLILEDATGIAREMTSGTLARILDVFSDPPCQMAILNCCHSEAFADALLKAGVRYVACINAEDPILDVAARAFARELYPALFQGHEVPDAFESAKRAVEDDEEVSKKIDPISLASATISEPIKFKLLNHESISLPESLHIDRTDGIARVYVLRDRKGNIPPASHLPFFGRQVDLHVIASRLNDKAGDRCILIQAMGGMGKTELALAAARWQVDRQRWYNGAWEVRLRNVDRITQARELIAATLSLPTMPDAESLASTLADRELLLILDDLDTLIQVDPERLSNLLEQLLTCPKIKILATSRLDLPATVNYETLPVGRMDEADARRLLETMSKRKAAGPDDETAKEAILKFLDGFPFAIKVAATYLRKSRISFSELLNRLNENPLGPMSLEENRDTSLPVMLGLTYRAMPKECQRAFQHLSLFPAGLDPDAIRAIFGVVAFKNFEKLIQFSMTEISDTPFGVRYSLPEPARVFAESKLDRNEIPKIYEASTKYYSGRLRISGYRLIEDPNDNVGRLELATEQQNILNLLRWGYVNDQENPERWCASARLTTSLELFWRVLEKSNEPLVDDFFAKAAATAERCKDLTSTAFLACISAERRQRKGDSRGARELFDRAIKIADGLQTPSVFAWVLGRFAVHELEHGNAKIGEQKITQSIRLYREIDEFFEAGLMLRELAKYHLRRRRPSKEKARKYFREAAGAFVAAEAWRSAGGTYLALANDYAGERFAKLRTEALGEAQKYFSKIPDEVKVQLIKSMLESS